MNKNITISYDIVIEIEKAVSFLREQKDRAEELSNQYAGTDREGYYVGKATMATQAYAEVLDIFCKVCKELDNQG